MTRKLLLVLSLAALGVFLIPGCIVSTDDPCEGIDCDGHGTCAEDANGDAYCVCEDNYHTEGLHCVFDGYTVSFAWAFGPEEKSCTQVQVTDVRVDLFEGGTELLSETVSCTGQEAELAEMEDGDYILDLTGLSNSGEEYYFGSVEFTVAGANKTLDTIIMDAVGSLKFSWVFGVDELDCTESGVFRVRVEVYDEAGAELLFEADPVPECEDGGAEISPFYLGNYNLVLEGVCESDLEVGYELDSIVELIYPGVNDFGSLALDDIGGCL